MTPLCPRSNDPPMFVSDLIHAATRPWNMEVVREHMYEMDAEAVANIPISHVAQPERMEEDSHKIGIINKNMNSTLLSSRRDRLTETSTSSASCPQSNPIQ